MEGLLCKVWGIVKGTTGQKGVEKEDNSKKADKSIEANASREKEIKSDDLPSMRWKAYEEKEDMVCL